MADAEARREARRRKILGNSANRLKLITGEHNGSIHVPDIPANAAPAKKKHDIPDIFSQPTADIAQDFINTAIHNHLENHLDRFEVREVKQDDTAILSDVSNNFSKYSQICIVVLAVITRILFLLNMQYFVGNAIFLPFLVTELTAAFMLESPEQANILLNSLLLFSNLPPNRILFITRILRFIQKVIADFGLYFMSFTITHLCLEITVI